MNYFLLFLQEEINYKNITLYTMGNSAKVQNISFSNKIEEGKTTIEKIDNTYTDELIFGICSPIGSQREFVIDVLKQNLENKYGYKVEVIKLSSYIGQYYKESLSYKEGYTKGYSNLMHKITGGDFLRNQYNSNSLLVELAIKRIREDREELATTDIKGRRVCYILDSLKNQEELQLLRSVYQEIFYLFSIFSPDTERINNITEKGLSKDEAKELIETDDHESIAHGQNVRETFIDGDFFVRASNSNKPNIETNIKKYLHLVFESKIITPTSQERAMYFAKSAAGNSACLSRQVGATITDRNGVPIAQGWNDVPKFGGNLYTSFDENNSRCLDLGYCTNVTHKTEIIDDILEKIKEVIPKSRNSL